MRSLNLLGLARPALLLNIWDKVRASFWFVPSVMMTGTFMLAAGCLWLDSVLEGELPGALTMLDIQPSAASALLSTIFGSAVTLAGLVFSLTVLTLSTATQQFGPRLLRTFLESPATQIAIGLFIATAAFSLIVLAAVRGQEDSAFVPHIALGAAVALALINLHYLVFFIQTVARKLQAPNLVSTIAQDAAASIARVWPVQHDHAGACPLPARWLVARSSTDLPCPSTGYLQAIDTEALLAWSARHDAIIALWVLPGEFVAKGQIIGAARLATVEAPEAFALPQDSIITGNRRTPRQDVGCAVSELAEVATRALSPGINDPYTAFNCIDNLGYLIAEAASRSPEKALLADEAGVPRILMQRPTFADLLDDAFTSILHFGASNPQIVKRVECALRRALAKAEYTSARIAIAAYLDIASNCATKATSGD